MTETMNIEDYLAQGGVLTSPGNVPARYRGELMRLMGSFVDSELAASAGFAGSINFAPGIKERIAASRITLEKADHAERVLAVMADFGTDTARYQRQHDWAARVARDADLGSARGGGDMRLSVFHYPIIGWADAVVMNVLMGLATGVQMTELTRVSYAPLAEVFRERVAGHDEDVRGSVGAQRSAESRNFIRDLPRRAGFRPLDHHGRRGIGKPGEFGRFVLRSRVKPEPQRHQRKPAVRDEHDR